MDITLVHGSPASGKNHYVEQHKRPGDIVVDADALAVALGSGDHHDHPAHIKSLGVKLRDLAIREAARGTHKTWVISSSPKATKVIPHTTSVHLDPGIDVCLSRAKSRPSWTKEAIREYYSKMEIPEPSRFAKIEWLEMSLPSTLVNVKGKVRWTIPTYLIAKVCGICQQVRDLNEFTTNRTCRDGRSRRCKVCDNEARQNAHLVRKYGITLGDKKRMIEEQNGVCPICLDPLGDFFDSVVDHDHSTGKVRQILCRQCNAALGSLQDDPDIMRRAAEYVIYHRKQVG